uniref:DUF1501 domain-containing protein n=1 Tax=Ditylum brightwellii TaxID=49249 RepID=A0A7S4SBN9_9STRA
MGWRSKECPIACCHLPDKHKTPDLSPIIQELVDRSGWVLGNSVVLIINGTGTRVAEAWDGDPKNAPLLVVTYSTDDESAPTGRSTSEIIDNLATLLTAGRLNTERKEHILEAVKSTGGDVQAGLRLAEQLVATTPEFHTTSLSAPSGENRQKQRAQSSSTDEYKSIVYLYFDGGCDSFNMLAPYSCPDIIDPVSGKTSNTYDKYLAIREHVALTSKISLEIDASDSSQPCTSFGIHPNLPTLRDLYNERSALFVANAGLLLKPVDKTNYREQTPTQLFSHNTLSRETKQVDLNEEISGTGVLGRLNDALAEFGYSTSMFSISGSTITLAGQPGVNPPQSVLRRTGLDSFNSEPSSTNMKDTIKKLNNVTNKDYGFMSETWAYGLYEAMDQHSALYDALDQVSLSQSFPATNLGNQLSTVAELIQTHTQRGTNRDLFYVSLGGFDTHADVGPALAARFDEVDGALSAFVNEMKAQGLWAQTTLVQFSDFARTLSPNSGNGTDHGWGQNVFIMGGSLNGGKIMGNYPGEFSEKSSIGLSRGRLIPTTPWDAIWNGIAQWCGVTTESDLDKILPMRKNFPPTHLFNISDLYT